LFTLTKIYIFLSLVYAPKTTDQSPVHTNYRHSVIVLTRAVLLRKLFKIQLLAAFGDGMCRERKVWLSYSACSKWLPLD